MRGFLEEKIGEGAFADIHAWAPGQVVKLFKASVPHLVSSWEARMTRAVFAAGAPAPEVFDEVTLEGRFGIVLPRLDGPTLLQLLRSGAMTFGEVGAILASLYMSVHKTPPPPDVLFLRDLIDGSFLEGRVSEHIATGILALIERLRPGDGLCHGDLHPGNVIMTADGPRIIDWIGAVRAPAALDLASCHVLLSELAPEVADDPQRPRAAVRVRAAGRHVPCGADGGDAAISAYPSRLCPLPAAAGHPCPAGAADPAHRCGSALGGLNFFSRACDLEWPRGT
jgi:tRNA A-37 threonylcarbamoyl transferase component Bud32